VLSSRSGSVGRTPGGRAGRGGLPQPPAPGVAPLGLPGEVCAGWVFDGLGVDGLLALDLVEPENREFPGHGPMSNRFPQLHRRIWSGPVARWLREGGKVLDKNRQKQVFGWMKEWFTESHRCPMCGKRRWAAGNMVVAPIFDVTLMGALPLDAGQEGIVMVQMVCGRCGYIMLLDARRAGLIPGVQQGS
jgi:hypothetical protein